MKAKVRTIHGHGKASEEYVIIDVNEDCNADHLMIADTTYTPKGNISCKVRHTHWFYPTALKKGDVLALFTGTGTDKSVKQASGNTVFYRYWGLKTAVWNDDGDGAILFDINTWSTKKVAETK
ncbi:hypothetical protein I5679_13965 [Citrobacter koseri]|uniref:hypothetical protein n=1 Tax=Citrobacter koseri TaxID=545 RepID=UPI00190277D1|nr:hypothetical protein [Citrobacter koseri]MBJ9817989.1 hypothetical protein [Citrobacter koseri]HBK3300187.1 hypothetical protein [Citrobacter koseri]HCR3978333.1 hypothetical protein [Citrobacter koseri]